MLKHWNGKDNTEILTWINSQELQTLLDSRDSADKMTCPHEIRPKGRHFLWLAGPPGAGKTTTSHFIARQKDFVSYEADCFISHLNPYINLKDENPLDVVFKQKPLKGISKERFQICRDAMKAFAKISQGENCDETKNLYTLICKEILEERQKMGGNWIVNQGVPNRECRDFVRKLLGPDLIFVILTLSENEQEKRIKKRYGDKNESVLKYFKDLQSLFKPCEDDEPNTFNVVINEEMTPEDVATEIYAKVGIN